MKLVDIVKKTPLKVINEVSLQKEVKHIYIGDLLSFVMANGNEDDLWLTVQRHVNVIAVAQLIDFAGIVFVQGVEPDEETIQKANEYQIPLMTCALEAYPLTKQFATLGL